MPGRNPDAQIGASNQSTPTTVASTSSSTPTGRMMPPGVPDPPRKHPVYFQNPVEQHPDKTPPSACRVPSVNLLKVSRSRSRS
jgi:hypothetical protein